GGGARPASEKRAWASRIRTGTPSVGAGARAGPARRAVAGRRDVAQAQRGIVSRVASPFRQSRSMGPIRRRSGWRALSVLNVPGAALAEKSASAREAHLTSAVPSGPSEAPGEAGEAGLGRGAG